MILTLLFCCYFVLLSFMSSYTDGQSNYIRGCYYTNWAQYRQDRGKFLPEYYEPGLCTHLFYAFAVMNSQFSVIPFEWNDESTEWSKGMYERVNDLKKLQTDLKTLLSFGGWVFSQGNKELFRSMISSSTNRNTFIQSAIQMAKKHRFDGFDLDWEYPENQDKANFATLLREMSAALRAQNLLFTAAVAAGIPRIEVGYDIPAVAQSLDFVNIMTYDMHGGWESATGHNSPLYDRNNDRLSVSNAINYWTTNGLPKEKIVVGFPTYGRSWTLTNPSDKSVGAPGSQATAGPFTREAGFLSYYEIKDMLASGGEHFYDELQKAPYMVKNNLWVGYDDVDSINLKLNWLKQNGYRGAFAWSLDLDDFNGISSGGNKYPLIKTIASALGAGGKPDVSYTLPPTEVENRSTRPGKLTTTSKPDIVTVTREPGTFRCPSPGLHADPTSCSYFYNCATSGQGFRTKCGTGLHFSEVLKVCDWPRNVRCTRDG